MAKKVVFAFYRYYIIPRRCFFSAWRMRVLGFLPDGMGYFGGLVLRWVPPPLAVGLQAD